MSFDLDLVILSEGFGASGRWDGNGGLHQEGLCSFVFAILCL